jgi:hypothetical protein
LPLTLNYFSADEVCSTQPAKWPPYPEY